MSAGMVDGESFAFTTGAYGDRPTYVLTTSNEDGEFKVTMYELAPDEIVEARSSRFETSRHERPLSVSEISDVIVGGSSPDDLDEVEDDVNDWGNWSAIKVATLSGDSFEVGVELVKYTFGEAGIDNKGIVRGDEKTSVALGEAAGVRLAVGFEALKAVRRFDKLQAIRRGVQRMSLGECYYWHSKIRSPNEPNGTTALRNLLAGHVN